MRGANFDAAFCILGDPCLFRCLPRVGFVCGCQAYFPLLTHLYSLPLLPPLGIRICTMLRAHRAGERVDDELENNMPYDAAHEKLRRKQLALLFARTAEEAEEEDFVAAEFKKINQV